MQALPVNYISIQKEEKEKPKSKSIGNLIMIASFIFLAIMLIFSTIGYASLYNHDNLLLKHIKVEI